LRAEAKDPEFLLEVGVEEIPAWMIEGALAELKRRLEEGLREARLSGDPPVSLEMYGTPRRLIAYGPSLPARQASSVETIQGPPKRVAFDAQGKPTAAANAFAAKMGAKLDQLETVSTPKGEYLVFHKKDPGRPTADILAELIPQAVLAIPFPRTMYWEGKSGPRFIRPIHSLLALLGGRVVPCAIGSVRAGSATFGHRLLGKPQLPVRNFAGYRKALRDNSVLMDAQERRKRILDGVAALLESKKGLRLKPNEDLLNTLVYLTEFPTPLIGEFDPAFLALPEEVLITVMKGHQKYLSLERADGTLAPYFIAVMNRDADSTGVIRHGHERVLRARFTDARFFWEADAETRLEQRLEALRQVTFQSQLGSYYDKADRMRRVAAAFALRLRHADKLEAIQNAARLAKCDLTTDLVKEFTELQGVVGGLYARREGLPEEVAAAIYDHYKPANIERNQGFASLARRSLGFARRPHGYARWLLRHRPRAVRLQGPVRPAPRRERRHQDSGGSCASPSVAGPDRGRGLRLSEHQVRGAAPPVERRRCPERSRRIFGGTPPLLLAGRARLRL